MRLKLFQNLACWILPLFSQLPLLAGGEVPENDTFYLGAKALIHNSEGKILLLQRDPNRLKKTRGACWDLPGGRVQKNESVESALKREVYEETGLKNLFRITPFEMVLSTIRVSTPEGDVGLIFAVHLCEIDKDSVIHLSAEHVSFSWFDPKKAAEQLAAANYPEELTQKIAKLEP